MIMTESVSVIGAELRSRVADVRQTGEGEYTCTVVFDPAFRGFEGHFDGNPIVPGVCLILTARAAAEVILGKDLATRSVANCRFRRPVLAGEQTAVRLRTEKIGNGLWKIHADIRVGGEVCTQLQLEAAES